MLKQHEFYVYHDENRVMARMGTRDPVVAEEFDTPQQAYEKAWSIVNPTGRSADSFAETDKQGRRMGYNSKEFQDAISANCEAYVKKAYSGE